ncbi:LOW QUALITY PROTEIN: wolframin-like [Macrobrachium nipponense]|uniref:LOW QUALITY PROTEIN: wolframin-like n=1 Tax=Macrobrachium nipponense TaxID=159736 RepID=UPI0030C7E048
MSATLPAEPTIPLDTGKKTSSRRQWSVQGGPRGLLRRMRSQLAEDGCPESQLVMGRTLLQQLGDDAETEDEDARLAVFWLNQSSLQGNKEATELLQDCLSKNVGICEHNYKEIRECLAMDLQEKLARRAAHLLFCSLSDGNDFINSATLSTKIHNLVSGKEDSSELDEGSTNSEDGCNLEKRYGGERLTEDHLVSSSVLYCEGRVPPLHYYITPMETQQQSQLQKILYLPLRLILEIYKSCFHFLGVVLTNLFMRTLNINSPLNMIAVLSFMSALVVLLGTMKINDVLPVTVACVALIVMMSSSAHMLLIRKRFDSFRMWSVVFSHYCPDLNTAQIENKFKSRCWKPYAITLVALLFYLGAVPLTSSNLLVNFLPALYLFTVLTLFLVPEELNVWQFISLFIHLLAVAPEICKRLSAWMLPIFTGTGLEEVFATHHIYVWHTIKLNLGFASVIHLVWCSCCAAVVFKHGLAFLLPHLVGLMWCHLAVMATQLVTLSSNLIIPVATWSILVMLPFFHSFYLTTVPGLLIAGLCLHIGFEVYTAIWILILCVALILILKKWWPSLILLSKVVIGCGVFIYVFQSSMIQRIPSLQHSNLLWENYKNVCWPSKDTGAATAHRCLPLQGTFVKWQGSVTQVEIVRIWNLPQKVLNLVPEVIEKPIRCYVGKRLNPCQGKTPPSHNDHCHVIQSALGSDTCVLDNWNEYTFEISLAMSSSSSSWKFGASTSLIKIIADNDYLEFVLGLQVGDEVEFIGALAENVGSLNPKLLLSSISCVNCKLKLKSASKQVVETHLDFWRVPPFVFNFLMGPILTV